MPFNHKKTVLISILTFFLVPLFLAGQRPTVEFTFSAVNGEENTGAGGMGICPPGWHVPTDSEMKILEGVADSQYGVGSVEWDDDDWNGFDVAKHLKATDGWVSGGNGLDTYGFSALPAGWYYSSTFYNLGEKTRFWTSNEYSPGSDYAWMHKMDYNMNYIYRYNYGKNMAHSVRCIRD